MSDQDDQQLVGFDDSPVLLPEPKKPPPSSAVAASQAELILNTLNSEKSQIVANGGPKSDGTTTTTTTTATTNGHHQEEPETKPVNGHGPKVAADHNGTEAGEPVYTEVPEDNIYEEVIPVQERKADVAVSPSPQNAPAENGGTTVLYDDSSLSSEVSTELSPPPSNVGDCGSNGTTLSDPECDAAMAEASAPESHADIPAVVVQESTPVDSDQSNDEQADDSASEQADPEATYRAQPANKVDEVTAVESDPKAECVAEPLVEPVVEKGSDSSPSDTVRPTAEPRGSVKPIVVAAALESAAARIVATACEFTRVDDVQFVEPEEAARCTVLSAEATPEQEDTVSEEFHDTREEMPIGDAVLVPCLHEEESLAVEHEARVEQPLSIGEPLHHESADVSASPTREPATTMATPTATVQHEPRHLKQSAEDSIIAREIRAQKEREEMIARERKLAQEAARLSSSSATEKTPCDRPQQAETTSKPPRLTTPQISIPSAPSAPSANSASPAPFPAPIEKRFTCPSDSKIADEIRELQEREEELRELRERLHVQTNEGVHKTNGVDESMVANGVASPTASSSSSSDLSRTVSIESLPPNGHHTPFGPRRKDKITVRPLSDGSEECAPSPTFVSHGGESPIEREIRLARDREEALRKEKGLLGQLQAEGFVKKGELLAASPATPVSCKNGKSTAAAAAPTSAGNGTRGSTQKILATSRIQQEIEEQTQREMALRDSGHIQTISQERTDSKVTRICSEAASAPSSGATSPSQLVSTSRRVPPFESSLPNVEIFEKTPPAAVSPARVTSPTTAPSGVATAVAKATNGHVSNGHSTAAKGSSPATTNGRGVSMQKFLASRGKELAFTSPPQNGGAAGSNGFADKSFEYRELKPPQLQKGASDAVRKGLVTAETKIQEEMRAMKEREEELRRQRQRLLGQSQPNLSLQLEGSAVTVEPENVVDGSLLQCVNNNPSIPAPELASPALCSSPDSTASASSAPRRRSALIAQWEQRIQSTDVAKS